MNTLKKIKSISYYFFLYFLTSFPFLGATSLSISEIFYETSASKYYNQVVELYNHSDQPVKITDYIFSSGTRTNKIVLLNSTQQSEFSSLNGIFDDEYLTPKKVAVIIDKGYKKEVAFNFKGAQIYSLDTTSLSAGNFLKKNEILNLRTKDGDILDTWELKEVTVDTSLIKIDLNKLGTKDNLIAYTPNLGEIKEIPYATDPFNKIILEEKDKKLFIIGIPQNFILKCQRDNLLALCDEKIFLNDYDESLKIYHYPKSSKNLVDPSDALTITAGISTPLTLFSRSVGTFPITFKNNLVPPANLTINSFPSPLKEKVFINEIFYNATNKNLVWLEVYTREAVTTSLKVHLWNSDFKFKKTITLPSKTYSANEYSIIAYQHSDFINFFSQHSQTINSGEIIDITANGIIAISESEDYIDSVYYDKNWYSDYISGRSLQRKSLSGYAFAKNNFDISFSKKTTPFAANDFSKTLFFDVTLLNKEITDINDLIYIKLNYPILGDLKIYLYEPSGNLLGRVYNKSIDNVFEIPLCIKKAKLTTKGIYSLVFHYKTKYGDKTISKSFYFK